MQRILLDTLVTAYLATFCFALLLSLLLLLVDRGGVNSRLDHTGSSLLPELVEGTKEPVLGGRVGLAVPLLVVPTHYCQL